MDVLTVLHERLGSGCETSREPLSCKWKLADGSERDLVYDPYNSRLKLYRLAAEDLRNPEVRFWKDGLDDEDPPFSKLIIYGLPGDEMEWVRQGFVREGIILGYFSDGQDTWIWSAFADGERDLAPRDGEHDEIVHLAADKPTVEPTPPEGFTCRRAVPEDAPLISEILQLVFPDYPTPTDADTVRNQITSCSNIYRLMFDAEGTLAAAASAEIDHPRRSAELTDCATRPEHRGAGLMAFILRQLEHDLVSDFGITNTYTIARADEVGMNCVFSKLGWVYTGRLVNNCRMPNGWESMNLWCRDTAARRRGEHGPA
jgi:putative beta-lysine N-acetyltransferase